MKAEGLTYYDGDNFPILRVAYKDSGAARDLANCATWIDVWRDGAFLVRRPGRLISPKTGGIAEYFLRGRETDLDGLGGRLIIWPILMVPYAADGTIATNLLLNPSFDTLSGSSPTRLPDSWSLVGSQTTEVFTGGANDPTRPATIFGSYWGADPGATSNTYLEQVVTQAVAAGDWASLGCWTRASVDTAAWSATDDASIMLVPSGATDTGLTRFSAEQDWTFTVASAQMTASHTTLAARLRYKGAVSGSTRFDDACLFVGKYKRLSCRPIRAEVLPRKRIAKTGGNLLAGLGGFERDSNADGMPDGWQMSAASGTNATLSLDADPANVSEGGKALKAVASSALAGLYLHRVARGHFKAAEQWTFSLKHKTGGTLIGTAPSIAVYAEPFTNGAGYRYGTTPVALAQTQAAFGATTVTATLPYDTDGLECRVSMGGATGTFWIDDAQLTRVAP